jgi:hypothetical protein
MKRSLVHSTELRDEQLAKRPATPLPWTEEVAILPEHQQDVIYIVHAANSYPRLMEALSGALDSQECNGHIGVQMVEEIRTLLRSLGESE